jgi:integrase
MLDKMKRGDAAQILTMANGRPWRANTFRHDWAAARDAAKITDLHFHDLRGTAVTMLAEAGATIPEIASITGHSMAHVATILEKYLSRTRALADAAIKKFENAKGTKFANQMQTGK